MVWNVKFYFSICCINYSNVRNVENRIFVTLISAILSQFSQPSGMKLFKQHLSAEQIQLAMSIYQTIFAIFMVLGPILGTFIFHSFGIYISIIITGIAFYLQQRCCYFFRKILRMIMRRKKSLCYRKCLMVLSMSKEKSINFARALLYGSRTRDRINSAIRYIYRNWAIRTVKESLQWLLTVNGAGMIVGGALAMVFAKRCAAKRC